jgi:hypothetical protein
VITPLKKPNKAMLFIKLYHFQAQGVEEVKKIFTYQAFKVPKPFT